MKSTVVRASFATLALAIAVLPARAEEWSKTYNISGRADLRVETSDANIRVTTWDQNTIEAKVITSQYKIGEGGIRVDERQTGDSVDIEVHFPHHDFQIGWRSHRVDIIIQMPREGKVNLRAATARSRWPGSRAIWTCIREMDPSTSMGWMASCTQRRGTGISRRTAGLTNLG